jgi:hypothetical protein
MYGDMQDSSSPFSTITQSQTSNGRLVTGVRDTSHVVSALVPTSTLFLTYKDAEGNPFGIGPVSGSVTVLADGATSMSVTLGDSSFYIRKMGGLTVSDRVQVDILDPDYNDLVVAYEGTESSPSTATATTVFPVIVFDSLGNAFACRGHSTPLPSCAGPWYSYHYVEICPKNPYATKAPTRATPPTMFETAAPTASTPLIDVVVTVVDTPPAVVTAFENARDFWNDIISNTHDPEFLPAGTVNGEVLGCSATSVFPPGTLVLNGLTVFATVGAIDGPGGTLARAGPCAFSYEGATASEFGSVMPRVGEMSFDAADLQPMIDDGSLERVIMHEMGHVIGIGTLWDNFREGRAGDVDNDPRYVGANGIAGYRQIGGLRSDIPLANFGGGGTVNAHWRESAFVDELMTGYATGAMTLSIMTIKSLQDLGYTVDESKAEAYSILLAQQSANKAGVKEGREFGDDILRFGNDEVLTLSAENLRP